MKQHAKPFVVFTLLAGTAFGAFATPASAAAGPAVTAPAPVQAPGRAQASKNTLLAYSAEADQAAYLQKVKALKAEQAAAWAELQREHKLATSNPMLSSDDLAALRLQQADEDKAAKATYAGQLEVLKLKYQDGDIGEA